LWNLDIDEGKLADDFTGRTWNVTVTSGTMARELRRRSGRKGSGLGLILGCTPSSRPHGVTRRHRAAGDGDVPGTPREIVRELALVDVQIPQATVSTDPPTER